MAFEHGALNANLAAAVGNDPALVVELREAFVTSALKQIDLLKRARCDANWHVSALKLKGLAASFGIHDLIGLADEAAEGAPGDPVILRKLDKAIQNLSEITNS